MTSNTKSAVRWEELKRRLEMAPHPEGGWYRRVFAEELTMEPRDQRGARPALTTAYYLLEAGEHAKWHRLKSAEIWVWLEGGPLTLATFDAAKNIFTGQKLGPVGEPGIEPVRAVPTGVWQAAVAPGGYALVAVAVGPGFEWSDFAWLRDCPEELAAMRKVAMEGWGGRV